MLPPDEDLQDRRPVWDALQVFWLDNDPAQDLAHAAKVCSASKYTLDEIEQIYWNEVAPALRFNMKSVAGEWKGFEVGWLSERILATHRFGRSLPIPFLHPEENRWWRLLSEEIER